MIRSILLVLVLSGCRPALMNVDATQQALSAGDRLWMEQITMRVNDLTACLDVQTRVCIDEHERQRKEP